MIFLNSLYITEPSEPSPMGQLWNSFLPSVYRNKFPFHVSSVAALKALSDGLYC